MIPDDKAQRLKIFLASLPEGVALRLARAVDMDRLAGGNGLPHDLILDGLRPAFERILADIQKHAVAIRNQNYFDGEALVAHLAAFSALSEMLAPKGEIPDGSWWGEQLRRDRAALAEAMDGHMERAPSEILGALPIVKTGAFRGGPYAPDVWRAPNADKSVSALRYARLIAGCRDFADALSFGEALGKAQAEAVASLRLYCEGLLRELRAAEGDRHRNAEAYFVLAAKIAECLLGAKRAIAATTPRFDRLHCGVTLS